jgi:hypothetical protein
MCVCVRVRVVPLLLRFVCDCVAAASRRPGPARSCLGCLVPRHFRVTRLVCDWVKPASSTSAPPPRAVRVVTSCHCGGGGAQNFDIAFDVAGPTVSFTAAACDAACSAGHPCASVSVSGGTSIWVFVGVVLGALAVWGLAVLAYIVWKRRRGEVPVFTLVSEEDDGGSGGGGGSRNRTRMPLPLPGMGEGGSAAAAAPGATPASLRGPPGTLGAGRHIALSVEGIELGALLGAPKDAAAAGGGRGAAAAGGDAMGEEGGGKSSSRSRSARPGMDVV